MEDTAANSTKKEKRSFVLSILYILFTVGVIIGYGFLNPEIKNIGDVINDLTLRWIFLAIVALLVGVGLDSLQLYILLRGMRQKVSAIRCIKITVVGDYYSALTPFSSGGQPAQVMYLRQDNVPVGKSSCVFSLKFVAFQAAVCIYFILGMILRGDYYRIAHPAIFYLTLLGIVINVGVMAAVLGVMFAKHKTMRIARAIINRLEKWRIIKHPEKVAKARETTEHTLQDFHNSAAYAKDSVPMMLLCVLISFVHLTLNFSITYCVYRALGMKGTSAMDIILLQSFLFLTVSFVPLPGASLAAEGGFALFFGFLFPGANLIYLATLIWRMLTYYSKLFVGAGVVLTDTVMRIFRHKTKGAAGD